jgi:hypothetical protein
VLIYDYNPAQTKRFFGKAPATFRGQKTERLLGRKEVRKPSEREGKKMTVKLFTLLFGKQPSLVMIDDPTVYQIKTYTNTYCGRIMYQDDVVIRFQNNEGRSVKILKQNITLISIV